MVRIHQDPPQVAQKKKSIAATSRNGGIAQLGERLLCKQEVIGSIPFVSTTDVSAKCI